MIGWLQITAGRGPQECQWVVFQLVSHLIEQVGQRKMRATLVETTPGDLPQTWRSALVSIEGEKDVAGFISGWEGSVKWVGKSMFRPRHKRKNWFVSVQALVPAPTQSWSEKEINVERMRSSGPGGQHANKTETAIRVTHLPTGLQAISRRERSQYLNRKLAFSRLEQLIDQRGFENAAGYKQQKWHQHNTIERGNARHVFKGRQFTPQR